MEVSGRRHNTDDIIATVLAVEPMKFIYRGRLVELLLLCRMLFVILIFLLMIGSLGHWDVFTWYCLSSATSQVLYLPYNVCIV